MKNIYNMTREEQYDKFSAEYAAERKTCGLCDPITLGEVEDAFWQGAEWADQTLLEKACKWWKDNWMFGPEEIGTEHRDFMIEQFRKAMEK